VEHPLLVGGDRVGTLLLDPEDPDGPEPRQARMVEQLLPTVALVCRAVGLAVEAEHARQDVARERDAERVRILGDLHDGLGPVLAGMSMRVQAQLRRSPTPLLESLAAELAEARGDLRRIVSGLTPSALHDADLAGALQRLVATFEGDGREIGLEIALEQPLPGEVAVAVYRCVAEGITNALRHGRASHVAVLLGMTVAGHVAIDVRDDGVGGPIAAGVGLTSLRQRAEQLGGSLSVGPYDGGGVLLHVVLPTESAA
jgi:signal transduction histidine kinase